MQIDHEEGEAEEGKNGESRKGGEGSRQLERKERFGLSWL